MQIYGNTKLAIMPICQCCVFVTAEKSRDSHKSMQNKVKKESILHLNLVPWSVRGVVIYVTEHIFKCII